MGVTVSFKAARQAAAAARWGQLGRELPPHRACGRRNGDWREQLGQLREGRCGFGRNGDWRQQRGCVHAGRYRPKCASRFLLQLWVDEFFWDQLGINHN